MDRTKTVDMPVLSLQTNRRLTRTKSNRSDFISTNTFVSTDKYHKINNYITSDRLFFENKQKKVLS